MSVYCQEKVQGITELVRGHGYEVDPVAVADAIVRRIVWEDPPPDVMPADHAGPVRQPTRLRGLVRVRRLVSPPPLAPRTALRA
ncbi:MAG TPA: hypothetical protein VGF70_08245 [Solirubrobacteraceae bacterium]